MIKLCYKEYPFKISLAACKSFFDKTGQDLQYIFLMYLDECKKTSGVDDLERMKLFYNVCTFETASHAIHALITDDSIPMAEIQDAMYRVSWLPSDRSDNMNEPWPLVMLDIAVQINDYFSINMPVKKKAIKEG